MDWDKFDQIKQINIIIKLRLLYSVVYCHVDT